jgi:hypothetical protein
MSSIDSHQGTIILSCFNYLILSLLFLKQLQLVLTPKLCDHVRESGGEVSTTVPEIVELQKATEDLFDIK